MTDNASVHSDEDRLAPMREVKRAPAMAQLMNRRGTLMVNPRKSISLGARTSLLNFAGRRRSRQGGDVKLENTYRMQPKAEERFVSSRVRPLVADTMEELLADFDYAAADTPAGRKACELAQAIRDRVKEAGFERYKVVVSACLFQRATDNAAAVATRAVWSAECGDSFVECRFQNGTVSAVATVHAFYFE